MFCFQGEQAGGHAACASLQDKVIGALIGLARATEGNEHAVSDSTAAVVLEGLFATQPGAGFDNAALLAILNKVDEEKRKLVPECYNCASACGRNNAYDMGKLLEAPEDVRSLKLSLLSDLRSIACAYRATALGCKDEAIHNLLYKALFAIGRDDWSAEELLPIAQDVKLACRAMADTAGSKL